MSKIKVITAYEEDPPLKGGRAGYQPTCCYKDVTVRNMREYCDRWGYDFVAKFDNWKKLELPHHHMWRKTEMLMEEMHDCEWILWLDLDCFFLNMTIPLDVFTDKTADLVIPAGFGKCPECGKPVHNLGMVCFRNCDWSRDVLQSWWNQEIEALKPNRAKEYTYCLGETLWISCHFVNNPLQASHIKVIPLRVAGWATITGKPEQLLTHQYAALEHIKLDKFKELESKVIR